MPIDLKQMACLEQSEEPLTLTLTLTFYKYKKDIIEIMCGSLEFSASTSYVICQL